MNKKKNLLNLFTQDVTYNYHFLKTDEPIGHLIYVIKNGNELNTDSLEFSNTKIIEELFDECSVKAEKFAPSVFFTEEEKSDKLKYLLDEKLSESEDFSNFINSIKDEYRILEIKDSLLYKKDPEAYNAAKQKEHEEHQKELWDEMIKQHENKKKKRENTLLAYNNDLIKLMKEYFESIIEFEKRDFDFTVEFEKLLGNLIDPETWIKVNDQPFICRAEICTLDQDKMNVFLTDNNDYSYTATLRFDKTALVTENVVRINDGDSLPYCMQDYEILIKLYEIDITNVKDWEFKNHTDRFEYVIDYLTPIFKAEKDKRQKEIIEKMKLEEDDYNDVDEDDGDEDDDNNKPVKVTQTSDWYFDVFVSDDINDPSCIALSEDGNGLDDQLGSHSLSQNVIDALNRAGIFGDCELMEAIWEVNDYESKTKEDIIKAMENEGFIYLPGFLS